MQHGRPSGAVTNQLEYIAGNVTNVPQKSFATRSRIMDAGYVAESTELARMKIISQASAVVIAHANQSKSQVLSLLRQRL